MLRETKRFNRKGKVSKLVKDLFDFYCRYAIDRGWDSTAVFDLIPILYLLNEDLFVQKKGKIDVILDGEDTQGQTLFKEGEGDHIVLIDADRDGCMKIFFEAIDQLDERYD